MVQYLRSWITSLKQYDFPKWLRSFEWIPKIWRSHAENPVDLLLHKKIIVWQGDYIKYLIEGHLVIDALAI